ncbi:hypothetical protein KUTeg_005692 [Tegillarca granosa]|uniref:Uncharacterized protein n=1 Tax=Tegillarca granosa TaxID=220873 RepID=A0ABQ9FHG0_TEGGR|nr:hypothetical protein KUTeg_005692 [Tegillarca granosa]
MKNIKECSNLTLTLKHSSELEVAKCRSLEIKQRKTKMWEGMTEVREKSYQNTDQKRRTAIGDLWKHQKNCKHNLEESYRVKSIENKYGPVLSGKFLLPVKEYV